MAIMAGLHPWTPKMAMLDELADQKSRYIRGQEKPYTGNEWKWNQKACNEWYNRTLHPPTTLTPPKTNTENLKLCLFPRIQIPQNTKHIMHSAQPVTSSNNHSEPWSLPVLQQNMDSSMCPQMALDWVPVRQAQDCFHVLQHHLKWVVYRLSWGVISTWWNHPVQSTVSLGWFRVQSSRWRDLFSDAPTFTCFCWYSKRWG